LARRTMWNRIHRGAGLMLLALLLPAGCSLFHPGPPVQFWTFSPQTDTFEATLAIAGQPTCT
jgi:hypothetical protein